MNNFLKKLKIKYFSIIIISLFLFGCLDSSSKDFEKINHCFSLGGKWNHDTEFCELNVVGKEDDKKNNKTKSTTSTPTKSTSSGGSSSSSTPSGGSSSSSGSTPSSAPAITTSTKLNTKIYKRKSSPKEFLKLTVEEAFAKAKKEGIDFRVIENNGKPVKVKKGFVLGRYNASVKNGEIVKVTIEGGN